MHSVVKLARSLTGNAMVTSHISLHAILHIFSESAVSFIVMKFGMITNVMSWFLASYIIIYSWKQFFAWLNQV